MALLKGPCHSILISGNLSLSNQLTLKIPYPEIASNVWQIAINDICFKFNKVSNQIAGISCNFVSDIKYDDQKQVISYHPILCQTLLNGKVNEKKYFAFDKTWFYVSNYHENFIVNFHSYSEGKVSNELLKVDCDVYITFLLQRVK